MPLFAFADIAFIDIFSLICHSCRYASRARYAAAAASISPLRRWPLRATLSISAIAA